MENLNSVQLATAEPQLHRSHLRPRFFSKISRTRTKRKLHAESSEAVRQANPTADDSADLEQRKFGSAEVFGGQALEKVNTFGDIGNLGKQVISIL